MSKVVGLSTEPHSSTGYIAVIKLHNHSIIISYMHKAGVHNLGIRLGPQSDNYYHNVTIINQIVTINNQIVTIINQIVINPRRACVARVTVVVLCICMCVYVCPLIPAASHIGITKERYQRILRNTGIV